MDAFKLLTRSTKLKPSSSRTGQSHSSRLPSAGQAATPQLFTNDANGKASEGQNPGRGTKRKRNIEGQANEEPSPAAPTFFSTLSSSTSEPSASKTVVNRSQTTDEREDAQPEKIAILSEPERKAILKTHKIKVTDLRTPPKEAVVEDEQPKKKKKRKEEKPTVLTRKQQKAAQRLYPEPLTSFNLLRSRYNISRRLAENIQGQGYTVPTEVQLGSLPLLLGNGAGGMQSDKSSGSQNATQDPDLLVVAPTGSGKTLAFMIPLINNVMTHHHQEPKAKGILAVIVAPTKELATQIMNEGRKLTVGTGVKVTAMRKGMRVVEDLGEDDEEGDDSEEEEEEGSDESSSEADPKPRRISRNATITKSDILVTTPLLLVNSLTDNGRKEVSTLPSVQSLILDEADVLLDPLFREQTLNIWGACVNPQLRVGLWSATMGSNIEELSKSTIKDRQVNLGLKEESALIRLVVGLKDSAIPNIDHKLVYAATEQGKLLGLRQLLHPTASKSANEKHLRPPFLVFTQTIPRAVALHSELKYDIPIEAGGSSRIAVLHSELSDSQRADVMTGFRKGEIWILITTDLLSRGVDFRGINGVVNYDIPNSSAAYIHRVGRTGRAGREGGIAVTFYTKEDIPYVKNIANVIAASEKLLGEKAGQGIQKWLLNALPDLSKRDKKELKQHGVRARSRAAIEGDGKDKRKTRISTKSGFERRLENNRKGAIRGSQRRKQASGATGEETKADDGAWGGFED